MLKKHLILPRGLLVFSFVDVALMSIVWVVEAPYLRLLGFTPLEYGILGSIMAVTSLAGLVTVGWLTDRFKAVPLIVLSLLLRLLCLILLVTGVKELIYLSAGIGGFASPLLWVPFEVLISRIVEKERYHYAYPYIHAFTQVGNAIGAYSGWIPELTSKAYGMNILELYRLTIIVSAFAALLLIHLLRGIKEQHPILAKGGGLLDTIRGVPRDVWRVMGKLALAEALIGLGASISIHNISYYFILKYKVGSGGLGTLYGSENLVMAFLMLLLPKLSERLGGSLRTYVIISSTSIPLLIGITLVNNYYMAMTLYIARTVLMNVAHPLLTAFTMNIIPPEHRGKASSIMGLSWQIPTVPGRSIGGYLLQVGLEAPLRITAALYVAALTYLMIAFRRHKQQ